jgi:hypothetical protein
VTLRLTAQEWIKLRDAALQAFPNELFSRGEITRRYTLAGVGAEGSERLGPVADAASVSGDDDGLEERLKD